VPLLVCTNYGHILKQLTLARPCLGKMYNCHVPEAMYLASLEIN